MMAIRLGSPEVVLLLLNTGANTDLQNKVKMSVRVYEEAHSDEVSWVLRTTVQGLLVSQPLF